MLIKFTAHFYKRLYWLKPVGVGSRSYVIRNHYQQIQLTAIGDRSSLLERYSYTSWNTT
jgi:hypothetical protein